VYIRKESMARQGRVWKDKHVSKGGVMLSPRKANWAMKQVRDVRGKIRRAQHR
jgi:hypothetical protein